MDDHREVTARWVKERLPRAVLRRQRLRNVAVLGGFGAVLLTINVASAAAVVWDKEVAIENAALRAKTAGAEPDAGAAALAPRDRVPDAVFYGLATLGGWPGIYAALYHFNHKLRNREFRTGMATATGCNVGLLALLGQTPAVKRLLRNV